MKELIEEKNQLASRLRKYEVTALLVRMMNTIVRVRRWMIKWRGWGGMQMKSRDIINAQSKCAASHTDRRVVSISTTSWNIQKSISTFRMFNPSSLTAKDSLLKTTTISRTVKKISITNTNDFLLFLHFHKILPDSLILMLRQWDLYNFWIDKIL